MEEIKNILLSLIEKNEMEKLLMKNIQVYYLKIMI